MQRGALLKEPVEADSRHRNDILAEDTMFIGKSARQAACRTWQLELRRGEIFRGAARRTVPDRLLNEKLDRRWTAKPENASTG